MYCVSSASLCCGILCVSVEKVSLRVLFFDLGPPFLSCQLKSQRPLQVMCQNPPPALSAD